jgi:hypothetical protein
MKGGYSDFKVEGTAAQVAIRIAAIEARAEREKRSAQWASYLLDQGVGPDIMRGRGRPDLAEVMEALLRDEVNVRKRLASLTDAERQLIRTGAA